jgi:hypothetical protein
MARRIGHELMYSQSEPPTSLRFHRQRLGHKRQMYSHGFKGPSDRDGELADAFSGVDESSVVRNGQNTVNDGMLFE